MAVKKHKAWAKAGLGPVLSKSRGRESRELFKEHGFAASPPALPCIKVNLCLQQMSHGGFDRLGNNYKQSQQARTSTVEEVTPHGYSAQDAGRGTTERAPGEWPSWASGRSPIP